MVKSPVLLLAVAGLSLAGGLAARPSASGQGPAERAVLDFDVFKTRVQPIFLKKREGLARCYVCHSQGTPFRLERLPAGAAAWTDEQSKHNFEAVRRLVIPADPAKSRLLRMPLVEEAGGTPFHPGGKRWTTREDEEWQILASWIAGSRNP